LGDAVGIGATHEDDVPARVGCVPREREVLTAARHLTQIRLELEGREALGAGNVIGGVGVMPGDAVFSQRGFPGRLERSW